jgi:hypothetical protein
MRSKTKNSESISNNPSIHQSINPASRYSLKKGLGCWDLTFDGQHQVLKHEQGLALVAHLLLNPPDQPIHALDLATRVSAATGKQQGISEIIDGKTGQKAYLESHSRLQERSPALDDALTMRAVIRQQNDLEAMVEQEDIIDPVKQEAYRELVVLYNYETKHSRRARDSAQRAVRAVRIAIKRFYRRLLEARDAQGQSIPVLWAFAQHLQDHLLLPSARCSLSAGLRTHSGFPGCFTYEAPAGVRWTSGV